MKDFLSALSGVIFWSGNIPYILAILRDRKLPPGTPGKTEPSKASWIIWVLLDASIWAGMHLKHAWSGQIVGATCGSLIVMLLALKYGAPGWTRADKICLAIAGISLPLGLIDPTITIVMNSAVGFVGGIPTFISMWKDPRKESRTAWALYAVSCIPAIFAVKNWTLVDATQPVSYAAGEALVVYLLFIRPLFKSAPLASPTCDGIAAVKS
ncbi:MAG: hypothetical protein WC641_05850 [Patescibacteria group bacterium]